MNVRLGKAAEAAQNQTIVEGKKLHPNYRRR
jgi:hypothetical protein